MLLKIALIVVSQVAVISFTSNAKSQINHNFPDDRSTKNIQLKEINKNRKISLNNSSESGTYMTLISIGEKNALGNPIYHLNLYANGEKIGQYPTVTGRAHTQNRNRHVSGTEAPLPNGRYSVAGSIVAGTHPEVGGRFLPIYPEFSTGRSALGIHYDPSYNKSNGEDGTAGCIALTNRQDLDRVLAFVRTHQPQHLEVRF